MLKKLRHISHLTHHTPHSIDSIKSNTQQAKFINHELLRSNILKEDRYQDPLRLLKFGYKAFSQNDEDGIIAEILRRIGPGPKTFIEFGVETGVECNSTLLLLDEWRGAWIEGSETMALAAQKTAEGYPVQIVNSFVTAENADGLISSLAGNDELSLLSIDIDFNDYWIWKSITSVRPRVVVIEYNATLPPHIRSTVAYKADRAWDGSNYFGASLGALVALGQEKEYSLVGCTLTGVNAFFVRNDLIGEQFCAPFTAENHYEPPRYWLTGPSGHPAGFGAWVKV